MKADYTEFDALLLARIQRKPAGFLELSMDDDLVRAAHSLKSRAYGCAMFFLDDVFSARLQALRRAGKIRYTRKTWEIVS